MDNRRQLRRLADRTSEWLALLTGFVSGAASIWVFCLMLLICADIAGRSFFNAPVQGVSEIVANSIVAIVFLQVAHALMTGRLTRTDILIGKVEESYPFAAATMQLVFHSAGVVVFALIASGTWPKLVDAWVENEFFGAHGVFTAPVWPIKACLFFGSLLTCAAFVSRALLDIKVMVMDGHSAPLSVRHSRDVKPRGWWILALFGVMLLCGYLLFTADLTRVQIGLVCIVFMLALICTRVRSAVKSR